MEKGTNSPEMCTKPSNLFNCPRCDSLINVSGNRIVVESCGHQKCRDCFITDEKGCSECTQPQDSCTIVTPAAPLSLPSEPNIPIYEEFDTPDRSPILLNSKLHKRQKFEILNDIIIAAAPRNPVETRSDSRTSTTRITGKNSTTNEPFRYPPYISKASTVDNKLLFHCKLCRKSFKSLNHRRYHMYCDPNVTKPLKCKVCDKRFITATHLNYHMKGHDEQQLTFACKLCDKTFLREGSLRKHSKKKHEGDLKYECKVCNMKLQYKFEIDVHKNKHNETFPFHCEVCGKGFLMKSNYKQHLEFHTGARNFSCDMCDKRFAKKSSLKFHISLHVKDPTKYNCTSCSKTFLCQRSLQRHVRIHTENRCYECPLCHIRSSRKDNMQRHLKDFHPTEDRKALLVKIIERFKTSKTSSVQSVAPTTEPTLDKNITTTINHPNNYRSVIQFVGRPKNNALVSNIIKTTSPKPKEAAARSYVPSNELIDRPNATKPLTLDLNNTTPATSTNNMKLYLKLLSPYLKPTAPVALNTSATTHAEQTSTATSFCYGPEHYNSMMNGRIGDVTDRSDTLVMSSKMTSEQLAIYRGILKPSDDTIQPNTLVLSNVASTDTKSDNIHEPKGGETKAQNTTEIQSRNDNFAEMHWRKRTSQCFSQMEYK